MQVPYTLGTPKPVATALEAYPVLLWLKALVEIAAVAGLSSGIIVLLIAQPRIFYAMSQDGLIGRMFGRVHERHGTPHVSTIFTGVLSCVLAGLLPIGVLGDWWQWEHCSRSRRCASGCCVTPNQPDLPRAFRVPMAPVVCVLGAATCPGCSCASSRITGAG